MMRCCLVVVSLCIVLASAVYGQDTDMPDGVYERVSLTNLTSGEQLDPGQQGLMIIAHGYYSMMTIKPDRPMLERGKSLEDMSLEDQVAHMKAWLQVNAHTGPCEVKGDTLVWYRNISENPREVGTVTRLPYQLKDGNLIIHFGLGNRSRWEWIWRKIR